MTVFEKVRDAMMREAGDPNAMARAAINAMRAEGPSAPTTRLRNGRLTIVPYGGHGEPDFDQAELWNARIDIILDAAP